MSNQAKLTNADWKKLECFRSSSGPAFKIAEQPRREKIALALAEKAGERHRGLKKKAMDAAKRQMAR